MKVVSQQQMLEIEDAYCKQGISQEQLIERIAVALSKRVLQVLEKKQCPCIYLLCGKGHNSADAFAIGIELLRKQVLVIALCFEKKQQFAALTQKKYLAFQQLGGVCHEIEEIKNLNIAAHACIIDGIFGYGFKGKLQPIYQDLISYLSTIDAYIISIDLPSGMTADLTDKALPMIKADETITLGLPKLGLFSPQAWPYVGKLFVYDMHLETKMLTTTYKLVTQPYIKSLLPAIKRTRHKYERGYVVGYAGVMKGAALLACQGALRAGAGIVRLFHDKQMDLSHTWPELICTVYPEQLLLNQEIHKAQAMFIGPGLGQAKELVNTVLHLKKACVVDADALSLMQLEQLHPLVVLTPHKAEMDRLLQFVDESRSYHQLCQNFVDQHHVVLILKGSPTYIFAANQPIFIVARGDPGMATAGSGDVLTGVVAALLAQGLSPLAAACSAAYIHAVAGELAAEAKSSYSMIASDIIDQLAQAFISILNDDHVDVIT